MLLALDCSPSQFSPQWPYANQTALITFLISWDLRGFSQKFSLNLKICYPFGSYCLESLYHAFFKAWNSAFFQSAFQGLRRLLQANLKSPALLLEAATMWAIGSDPEVYDLCPTFARCASQKTHGHARIARETHGHARIARVLRVILACPCFFWLTQRAKTCDKIWYLGPLRHCLLSKRRARHLLQGGLRQIIGNWQKALKGKQGYGNKTTYQQQGWKWTDQHYVQSKTFWAQTVFGALLQSVWAEQAATPCGALPNLCMQSPKTFRG